MSKAAPQAKMLPLSVTALIARLQPWQARAALLLLAAVLTMAVRALFPAATSNVEERLGNWGWLWSPVTVTEERVAIIAIDDKSIEEVGAWPWPRETMAQLATRLQALGVQQQIYDIVFAEAKTGDDVFIAALQNTSAIVAQVPDLVNAEQQLQTGVLTHPLSGVACRNLPQATSFVGNAAGFSSIPKGHISQRVAEDGAVRDVPALVCVQGQAYPALAISALLNNAAANAAVLSPGQGLLAAAQELSFPQYPGLRVPVDQQGNLRVSFKQAPSALRAISASDVLNGRVDAQLLANTWVLVGYTAFGTVDDVVPTPYSGATPGVELHARTIVSLLDNQVPYTPKHAAWLLLLVGLGFAAVLWLLAQARDKFASYGVVIAALVLPLAALFLHAQVLSSSTLWLGWLSPALFSFIAGGFLLLLEYANVRLERSRVLSNLSSYLPAEVAQEIAYSLPNSSINAQRKNVTLLSADLRNFSAYGESRPPEESAALLHFFFTKSTDIIEQHQGRVHEFKGDSLLAVWDGSDSKAAAQAMQAAIALQQSIAEVLPQQPPAGLEPLALGIGIEQGPVLIGSIGPAHRRTHTLLGETVTIALRIQEMTAELAAPVLIGECAARQLAEQGLMSQGSYLLAGLRNPHILYALPFSALAPSSAKSGTAPLKLLRGGRN